MYEMVTGKVPFDGGTTVAIAIKHLQEEIVPPAAIFTAGLHGITAGNIPLF